MSYEKSEKGHRILDPTTHIPDSINSVYVDKILLTTHPKIETATMTLLSTHVIPAFKNTEGWTIDHFVNDFMGELKMPKSELLFFCIYAIEHLTNGCDVKTMVNEFLKNNPQSDSGFSFGPNATRTEIKDA